MAVMKRVWSPLIVSLALAFASAPFAAVPDIYPAPQLAASDLAAALRSAASTHRRVILDFGGNWCPDCHVLDGYFHDAVNGPILAAHFLVVHINVGDYNQNLDLAQRYAVPLKKGVPALAVLDGAGRLLYTQQDGEFQAMRRMQSGAVTQFLQQWMAPAS